MADYAPGTEQYEQQIAQSGTEMTQNISEQNDGQFQQRGNRGQKPGDKIFGSKDEDDETKLFIGGLNYQTTDKALQDYFSQFGDIVDAVVKTDDYGKSRCFAFVKFADPKSSRKVLEKSHHIIDHKQVDCKIARKQPKPDFLKVKKLFVGGLTSSTTEKALRDYFGSLGTIISFDQPADPNDPKKKRGFCFITFDTEDAVNEAMKSQYHYIGEEQARVEVKRAQNKGERGPDGFGYQGQQRGPQGQTGYWGAYQGQGGYDQNAYSQQYNQYAQNFYQQQYPNQYPAGYYGQQQQPYYGNYDQTGYYSQYNQQTAAAGGPGYNYNQSYDYSQTSYPGYTTGQE